MASFLVCKLPAGFLYSVYPRTLRPAFIPHSSQTQTSRPSGPWLLLHHHTLLTLERFVSIALLWKPLLGSQCSLPSQWQAVSPSEKTPDLKRALRTLLSKMKVKLMHAALKATPHFRHQKKTTHISAFIIILIRSDYEMSINIRIVLFFFIIYV